MEIKKALSRRELQELSEYVDIKCLAHHQHLVVISHGNHLLTIPCPIAAKPRLHSLVVECMRFIVRLDLESAQLCPWPEMGYGTGYLIFLSIVYSICKLRL